MTDDELEPVIRRALGEVTAHTQEARRQIARLDLERRTGRAQAAEPAWSDEDTISKIVEGVARQRQPSVPDIHVHLAKAPSDVPPSMRGVSGQAKTVKTAAAVLAAVLSVGGAVKALLDLLAQP